MSDTSTMTIARVSRHLSIQDILIINVTSWETSGGQLMINHAKGCNVYAAGEWVSVEFEAQDG